MKKNPLNYLPELVNASFSNDNNTFESVVLSLIRVLAQDEDNKKIAEKLSKMLSQHQAGLYPNHTITRSVGGGASPETNNQLDDFVTRIESYRGLNELILNKKTKSKIEDIIISYKNKDKLNKVGLKHSQKIILNGPPGTGKSTIGSVIAKELGLETMIVNIPYLFSSYLGDSGKTITRLFKNLMKQDAVIVFDEFDSIAAKRSMDNEIGEMRRIVNSVLTSLDSWNGDGIIIATTNDWKHLDYAAWRRFDEKIDIDLPDLKNREKLWEMYSKDTLSREEIKILGIVSETFSPAEIEIYSQQALRMKILKDKPSFLTILDQVNISIQEKEVREKTVLFLKENYSYLTTRDIALLIGSSKSTIQRYLSKKGGM